MKKKTDGQYSLDDYKLDFVRVKLIKDKTVYSNTPICNMDDAVAVLGEEISDWQSEAVLVMNLDAKNVPLNVNIASVGTIGATVTSMREMFKSSVLSNAASVIVLRNKPCGDATPEKEDKELARKMVTMGLITGIEVIDYITVARNGSSLTSCSLYEEGMLKPMEEVLQIVDDTKKARKKPAVAEGKATKKRKR